MITVDFNKLLYSVSYWLSYQDRIGRNFMINESSLKYPVADYLTGLRIPVKEIKLEFPHPDLLNRRIDLVTLNPTSGNMIENSFEFKIAQHDTKYEAQQRRIFSDLMRTYLVSKNHKGTGYFLIAGKHEDFIQSFRSISTRKPAGNNKDLPEPEGVYTRWLGFKIDEVKTFDVTGEANDPYKTIYQTFAKDYEPSETQKFLELPKSITTRCVAISALSREFSTPYVGGIWKVE